MLKALLVTIGTEITCGEVVNTNAAWASRQLEELGVRVFSHLTVRDQAEEIHRALEWSNAYPVVVVTGGLGPTSDDITRQAMATYFGQTLEFDEAIWAQLKAMYVDRGLPLREAHRHQCWFPKGSTPLPNPAGSALGFTMGFEGRSYYVLPGPPRELEAMWDQEVRPRLTVQKSAKEWVRWTCLGSPESEVAELVEKVIAGQDVEVGYRAQVPYVKIKVYVDPATQGALVQELERVLAPFIVAHGTTDLAEEVLKRWPLPDLALSDEVTGAALVSRLLAAWKVLEQNGEKPPNISFRQDFNLQEGLVLRSVGEEFTSELRLNGRHSTEKKTLPYRTQLGTERGKRSATEWALWHWTRALAAQASTSAR